MSKFHCHRCKAETTLPEPSFETGAIGSVACPSCGEASVMRSPVVLKEEDALEMVEGDMSLLGMETTKPPSNAIPAALATLRGIRQRKSSRGFIEAGARRTATASAVRSAGADADSVSAAACRPKSGERRGRGFTGAQRG